MDPEVAIKQEPELPDTHNENVDEKSRGTKEIEDRLDELSMGSERDMISYTEEEEKAILKKFDWRVLSMVSFLFMFSFLDRSNIGNANTAGMSADLGLSNTQYQLLLTNIGYVTGQPTTLLWKVLPPHVWVACLTLSYASFAMLQGAATNWGGLIVLRLFLGWAETAYGPGVPYFLSFFYRRKEIGIRQGIFLVGAPLATAYSGALAYGISHANASIPNWRLVFLIEGIPAVLIAPLVYFYLPDKASTAWFLTPREKEISLARGVRDGNAGRDLGLSMKKVFGGLTDPKAFIHSLMYFSSNVSYGSLPVFLPTIVAEMGFSTINAQGLTAPPYLVSAVVLLTLSYLSDRHCDRSFFIIPMATLAGVGYVILATVEGTGGRYFATFLVAQIFPVIALILPWVSNTHEDDSRRGAGFMLLNIIGQCGPFLGTTLYPKSEGPQYVKGMSVCAGFMFFVATLALINRLLMIRENKMRDELYGYIDPKTYGEGDISHLTEKLTPSGGSTAFRFIL